MFACARTLSAALLLGLLPARGLACEAPGPLVDEAEQAVQSGDSANTEVLLRRIEEAWACGPVASTDDVARVFLVQAQWMHLLGATEERTLALASAQRLIPGIAAPAGLEAEHAAAAAQADRGGAGTVRLEPERTGYTLALDGRTVPHPVPASRGMHLLQVLAPDDHARLARLLVLSPEEVAVVDASALPPLPAAGTAESTAGTASRAEEGATMDTGASAGSTRGSRALRYGGVAGLALGGTAAVLARLQDGAMNSAGNKGDLDDAFGRQKGLGYTAYGLLGLGAAGVGFSFVF